MRHPKTDLVSTHSRPKAAGARAQYVANVYIVSTHSRPKAAGRVVQFSTAQTPCFNTQPPEGGWGRFFVSCPVICCFNTQPPEGGWASILRTLNGHTLFQHTAARRRLAHMVGKSQGNHRSFNTQPPEGGWENILRFVNYNDSFNTQPPEGGWLKAIDLFLNNCVSTHSRPKAAGQFISCAAS